MSYRTKILILIACLFTTGMTLPVSAQNAAKVQETLIGALKRGDGVAIGNCLNDLCDLDVPGFRGTYSKAQAGRIIRDYFGSHTLTGFRMVRQGTLAEKEQYTMAEMKSGSKTWKFYFVVKEKEGKGVVPLFHITE